MHYFNESGIPIVHHITSSLSALVFTIVSLEAVIWKKDKIRQSPCQPTVQPMIKPLAQLLPHINAAYIISPLTNHHQYNRQSNLLTNLCCDEPLNPGTSQLIASSSSNNAEDTAQADTVHNKVYDQLTNIAAATVVAVQEVDEEEVMR